MKKYILNFLPAFLFISCEDNDVVDTSEGVKVQWIGFGGKSNGSSLEYLWFLGSNPKPSFPYDSDDHGGVSDTEYDGWNLSNVCDEIEPFQSEGYFNYILSSNPTIKRTIQLDDYYDMMWEE